MGHVGVGRLWIRGERGEQWAQTGGSEPDKLPQTSAVVARFTMSGSKRAPKPDC